MKELQFIINRIKDLVGSKGISVNKALIESGVGKDLISDMRKGQTPSPRKFSDLADYLDVSVDYLLGRTDSPEMNRKT